MKDVLLVDNEDVVREVFGDMLTAEGYNVKEATNGDEALVLLERNHFDLLLTDIFMPEKDGIELIRELKNTSSEIKIVAYSGLALADQLCYFDVVKKLGADWVFSKPIRRQEFIDGINGLFL